MKSTTKTLIYLMGMLIVAGIYFKIRLPLLTEEASVIFWDSDFSIFVMMAEDIKLLKDFPLYYWGAGYLGPLNNIFMAIVSKVADLFGHVQTVPLQSDRYFVIGPLIATFSTMLLLFLGILFWSFSFLKKYSLVETLLVALGLSLGGFLMIKTSARPLGPEVAFLLGALSFFQGYRLVENPTKKNQFLFGLTFGFCWWMNQIIVFTLAPVAFYFTAQSKVYQQLRNSPQIWDRFFLRWENLKYRKPHTIWVAFLKFIYPVALLNFLLGVWVSMVGGVNYKFWGIKIKINNGFSPIKTSLLIFGATQFLLWLTTKKIHRLQFQIFLFRLKPFFKGFFIGFGPVLFGKIFKIIKPFPAPRFQFIPLEKIPDYYENLIKVYFPKLLFDHDSNLVLPFFLLLFIALANVIIKNWQQIKDYLLFKPGKHSPSSLIWSIPFYNIVYILICERARDMFALRYSILVLPIFFLFVVTLHRHFQEKLKVLGLAFSLVLTSTLFYGKFNQGQETIKWILGHPKIDEKLEVLLESDCELYFSNYWNTYLFEYFTQKAKGFAVVRGQDRTPERTRIFQASEKQKCNLNELNFEITKI